MDPAWQGGEGDICMGSLQNADLCNWSSTQHSDASQIGHGRKRFAYEYACNGAQLISPGSKDANL